MALLNEIHLNSGYNYHYGTHWVDYGVFGNENYWFMWRLADKYNYLRCYNYSGILLWERHITEWFDDTYYWTLGAGVICNNRLYIFHPLQKKVGWVSFTGDPISDFPSLTFILSKGTGVGDLQGLDSFKWWSATVYQNQYLFHCDTGANRILVTDLDGNYIGHFGTYGNLTGQFYHPVQCAFYGDYLFVAEEGNRRISVWKVNSINPFDIVPLNSAGISGLLEDEEPHGIGVWEQLGQVYIICKDRKVREYKINSDLSLTFSGNYFEVDSNTDRQGGRGIVVTENHVVATAHEYPWLYDEYPQHSILVHTITDNQMHADANFDCYGLSLGVNNPISFNIRAGHQGIWKNLPFSFTGEGYIQDNRINGSLDFSMQAKHDIYACINSLDFNLFAGQNDLRRTLQFSVFAKQNYMMSDLDFGIETDTFATEFLQAENQFSFEMVASSPLTYFASLSLNPPIVSVSVIADVVATMLLELEDLFISILEAIKANLELPSPSIVSRLLIPQFSQMVLGLDVELSATIEVPHAISINAILNSIETNILLNPDYAVMRADLLPAEVSSIALISSDRGGAFISLPLLNLESSLIILPSFTGLITLPSLLMEAIEIEDFVSIEDIYQNDSLVLAQANYPTVEGVEWQGVILNPSTGALSRIANTEYFIIDLGYIDLHRNVVNHYLEVFIAGHTDQPDESIGELIANDYTYEIEPWISNEEWRVVIGKGITRRTAQNKDKRFLRLKLKLKNNFELKGISIIATPTRRKR